MVRFGLRVRLALVAALASVVVLGFVPGSALGQIGGGGDTGGGGNTIGGGGSSGVAVDAEGVLRRVVVQDPTGRLAQRRVQEALARLDQDVARRSPLRKVSLTRLEKIIRQRLAGGSGIDDTMRHLAGLTRVQYVFCYPETGDIVLAGPAEAWGEAPSGRMQGIETGRPVIELEDLIVALRAFPPGGDRRDAPFIYCSIDPTPEGLSRMHQFLAQAHRHARPEDEQFIVEGLRRTLGMQVVTVGGIPASTHFAQVLVEADYRMKLIGIGMERPPVRLKNYVQRANPAQIQRNALERWFFVPNYECVRVSDDALAMEMVGEGVKLVGEAEVVARDGSRSVAAKGNRASQAFVNAFTKVYPELSERSPVFAQLRNCIDLAVVAAYVQQQDLYELVQWEPVAFADEATYPVETYNAPQQVESAVTSIWKGNTLVMPIGGGVQIRPTLALEPTNLLDDDKQSVAEARSQIDLSNLAPDQWWWD